LYTVEQALAKILAAVTPLPSELIALTASAGRVLSHDIRADIAMPPFDNSAVDGYAVRAMDTVGAVDSAPVVLTCVGEILAGVWPDVPVGAGQCVRIMTGAPMPPGADAVVMVEDTRVEDTRSEDGERVSIRAAVGPGQHIRYAGEDLRVGDLALTAGTHIRAAQIGLLAQMGRVHVPVTRLPRVAVISTGDEVVELEEGVVPTGGKIRNSNSYALAALVQEAGALVHSRLHLPDDLEVTLAAFRQNALAETEDTLEAIFEEHSADGGADVIVTAGGVSMGDRDYVKTALETLGTLDLWRVAMKPGKPLAFGRIGRTLFFGLPGNPVSAQVTFELFVRPALRKMAGGHLQDLGRRQVEAVLLEPVAHAPGRREYVRAITEWQAGGYVTRPLGGQSSADTRSLALANSLLILPEASNGAAAGETLPVLLLD
jgi:molybdopterin molybdotransferase